MCILWLRRTCWRFIPDSTTLIETRLRLDALNHDPLRFIHQLSAVPWGEQVPSVSLCHKSTYDTKYNFGEQMKGTEDLFCWLSESHSSIDLSTVDLLWLSQPQSNVAQNTADSVLLSWYREGLRRTNFTLRSLGVCAPSLLFNIMFWISSLSPPSSVLESGFLVIKLTGWNVQVLPPIHIFSKLTTLQLTDSAC